MNILGIMALKKLLYMATGMDTRMWSISYWKGPWIKL